MKRILIAECKQEVSSFNPVSSHYSDFRIFQGFEGLGYHRSVKEEIGGALNIFDKTDGIELIPGWFGSSNTSGGLLDGNSFKQLSQEFIESIENIGLVDGVYFSFHGAMQSESENDPEGYLLEAVRKILGEEIPIVISLDLHGIITDTMLKNIDAIVVYHTYPHVDFYETGSRAASLLLKIVSGLVHPVIARVKIPVLARGDELITNTGSVAECIEFAKVVEAKNAGFSASVMWGNPFTDVPELCSNAIVVADNDEDLATDYAIQLANLFWKNHKKMKVQLTSLEEAVKQAISFKTGTVVMMDAADATSSGSSGDSNAILREVIKQGYQGTMLVPIVDPVAVEKAFTAGVGAKITTKIGGSLDFDRYLPLEIEAYVRSLSDGSFRSESFGWQWDAGKTAVLQTNNITLVVGTRPVSLFDRSWFYANGQDPRDYNMVVVKSPHCESHMYADWCEKLINVDAPGSTSANLESLGHKLCARPVFPLDKGINFVPSAKIFMRSRYKMQRK